MRVLFVFAFVVAAAVFTPAASAAVVLNEINCEGTDWVELVNTADSPADVSGWLLTDDPIDRDPPRDDHRFTFPASTVIPAQDDLVVEKGATGFPFGISCGNDTVRLADGAQAPVDDVAVPTLTTGVDTWGRYPNGSGSWVQTLSTKGAPNEPSSAGGSPPSDQAAWMFDPTKVVQVDITLPEASADALNADPDEYQDATFSLTTTGGSYGPLNVGLHLKGGVGSFRDLAHKAAFKIKFAHSVPGQRFLGLKKLTLNNMVQDPSMVHEALAYEAFRAMAVPAPRTGYAYVRVNGAEYGLYLNLETLDDVSLARWVDSTAHLYEGEYGMDVEPGGAGAFEVDEGNESDRSDLEALIDAVMEHPGDWSDRVSQKADLDEMTRMWAVEKYIGHWDGYAGTDGQYSPNNFYLHSDSTAKFRMIPWGTDQTWNRHLDFRADAGVMFDRCLTDASCAAMYDEHLAEARATIIGLDMEARATALSSVIDPWRQQDPRREYSAERSAAELADTKKFIASRPNDPLYPPAKAGDPQAPASSGGQAPAQLSRAEIAAWTRASLTDRLHSLRGTLRKLGLARLARRRSALLRGVFAAEPGLVRVEAKTAGGAVVLRGTHGFGAAGSAALRLRLTKAGRRLARVRHRLPLVVRGSFTNQAGRRIRVPPERFAIGR